MTTVNQQQRYTTADLEALPDDGTHRELIAGELIEMPGAKPDHSELQGLIVTFLTMFILTHKTGKVLPELGCQLTSNPDTLLFPDVGYVSAARLGTHDLHHYLPFAPDLAVEIVSPGNTADEMAEKIDLYFQHGAKLIWIVYGRLQKVHVYTDHATSAILDRSGTLDGGDVLPGFTLKVADLFDATRLHE